jgi:hypothetical protein
MIAMTGTDGAGLRNLAWRFPVYHKEQIMLRSKASRLFSLVVLCGAFVFSQSVSIRGQAAKFSSLYTDLKTECKAAVKLKKGENPEGQDMPLKCKGYGRYEVRIDYSATSSSLRVQPLGDKSEQSISLGMQPLDYDQKRKIEWRLANGKPFAVIYRIVKSKSDQPEETWSPANMGGEFLVIKGLKGHERIDLELDATTPNANIKAREMADSAYAQKR